MIQRKTQNPTYWQEQFSVSSKDVEFIYNHILEEGQPVSQKEIAIDLIGYLCEVEEQTTKDELEQGKIYYPKESYQVDDTLLFLTMDSAIGTVKYTRRGHHPDHGSFTVLGVSFPNQEEAREFVADFEHDHPLNSTEQTFAMAQGLMTPEDIYENYQAAIDSEIQSALKGNEEFVRFQDHHFLHDLLVDFHEGLFNIADAAIDINEGPLGVDTIVEQMGLASGSEITDIIRFSVNYRLADDERFVDVGPTGEVRWFLERLEPPEILHKPRRLQLHEVDYDISQVEPDTYALLDEVDDESTQLEDLTPVDSNANRVTVVLNYPHHRVGSLPLTPKTELFFPLSNYNPVLFEFVDGRTGDTFPGWAIKNGNYVFGLDKWYRKNKLPVGAFVTLKRTDNPMRVIIDYRATRTQRDWIRVATVNKNRLNFQMTKFATSCKYDELMIIGNQEQATIDQLWLDMEERKPSVFDLLRDLFPELAKLNPQSTVHAKTLYSAINIIRRTAPGVVFQALAEHACFKPINNGYWTYDSSLVD